MSGLFRQAAVDEKNIDPGKAAVLTSFLGTEGWREELYTRKQAGLFDDDVTVTRDKGYEGILQFTTKRLRTIFPYVGEPRLLGKAKGAPLFALYFAVANPSKAALSLASRVSRDILSKLR